MRHLVVLSHPDPASFNAALAEAYVMAAQDASHDAEVRDLYGIDFDPRLKSQELPWRLEFAPGADVVEERRLVAAADVIAFVYPLWFNAPPAMLKGYVERVFGMGFGYEPSAGGTRPLLSAKSLVSISTSGAPNSWVDQTGAMDRLRTGFDQHLAAVCGFRVGDHLHFGDVTPGMRRDAGENMLGRVRQLVSPAAEQA